MVVNKLCLNVECHHVVPTEFTHEKLSLYVILK